MEPESVKGPSASGKWVVLVMFAVALLISFLRWKYIPKTNPREADPGSPYYSQPQPGEQSGDVPQTPPPAK